MQKTLINASNLHVGGGVQVAVSAISEIAEYRLKEHEFTISVSDEVSRNLGYRVRQKFGWTQLIDVDVRGVDFFNFRFRKLIDRYDKVFTIFGPLYRWRIRGQNIVGFAQPWIIFPRNEVYKMLPWPERLKTRLKFFIQKQFYKRADILVVELEHVKDSLVRELGVDPARVRVVRNCVSSVYTNPESWLPLGMPDADGALRLGFLGRNYPHKNTAIFPKIAHYLRQQHSIEAKFFVTFTPEEWEKCSPEFRAACVNVGPISVGQCPNFYSKLDAVVFPSLLECFSATPLEAMFMRQPLFASDRRFNRDVCENHAQYFDPHSPEEAARLIANMFRNGGPHPVSLEAARAHALSFSSPVERAKQYLALLGIGID
jgi:glycosyltransferase involved in cell wall biosynthesis